ncbi:MAG: erythromycin esterase family protein [Ruminiclostridium sp.]|nr:erythromycin esterase family protein [Ruminiclostridium sp.]
MTSEEQYNIIGRHPTKNYTHPAHGKFTVRPPPPVNAEWLLNRLRFPDYMLDMRTVGKPARAWLNEEHPVRYIFAAETEATAGKEIVQTPLRRAYDILIHMRYITVPYPIPGVR